jgi:hypothetical protein
VFPDQFDEGEDRGATVRLPLGRAPAPGGFLWLAFDYARRFEPDERAFMCACAEQCALALERARLYEEQRNVALTLQRSLIAGDPPIAWGFSGLTADIIVYNVYWVTVDNGTTTERAEVWVNSDGTITVSEWKPL